MSLNVKKPIKLKKGEVPTQTGWHLINPASAAIILEANVEHNRTPFKGRGDQYKNEIANDSWFPTGQPIIFDWDNNLIDGQNRVAACVKSGKSFVTFVMTGIDPAAFAYIDTGKARTPSDILKINGVPYSGNMATIARLVWEYKTTETPLRQYKAYAPPHLLLDIVDEFPEMNRSCYFVMSHGERWIRNRFAILVHFATMLKFGEEQANETYLQFSVGDNLRRTSPLLQLRNLCVANYTGNVERVHPSIVYGSTVKALNMHFSNKPITSPTTTKYNPKIEPFPRFDDDLFNCGKADKKLRLVA